MKNNYVANADRQVHKPHNMSEKEITRWFVVWGIVGKLRRSVQRDHKGRVIRYWGGPVFDRGPGPCGLARRAEK